MKQAVRNKVRFLNRLPADKEAFLPSFLSFSSSNPEHIVQLSEKSCALNSWAALINLLFEEEVMQTRKIDVRFGVIAMMILAAAFSRLIPHPANFAPIGAMALFGAAHFKSKWAAFIVPLLALWLSDLVVINVLYAGYYKTFTLFYGGFYRVYGAIALTTALGFWLLKKVNFGTVAGSGIAASLLFFIVTNFGSWHGTRYKLE